MLRTWMSVRGFTAAETAIVLSTVSVLAAAVAPAVADYVHDARLARAREDVRVIADAVSRVSGDLLSRTGVRGGLSTLQLAAGEGDVPELAPGADNRWALESSGADVGALNDHLFTNAVGYPGRGASLPAGIAGWRGPYLDRPLGTDPWGRRYAVRFGKGTAATVVLSAGPDGIVSTIDSPHGMVAAGDDILSVISGR
jgi:type II secretory pathway pseudopilin PulG